MTKRWVNLYVYMYTYIIDIIVIIQCGVHSKIIRCNCIHACDLTGHGVYNNADWKSFVGRSRVNPFRPHLLWTRVLMQKPHTRALARP